MKIYTIGHSTQSLEDFYKLLNNNDIDVVVDVRSVPYSKYADWFNKENLISFLKSKKLYYIGMGDSLGARWEDRNLTFFDGRINFQKIMETKKFQDGIDRVIKGIEKGYNIALMCSEKEVFDCHRFVLVSQFLKNNGIKDITHIYPDKVITNRELELKLLKKYNKFLPQKDLFNPNVTEEEKLKKAYELRNKDIAYNIFTKEGDYA